MKTLLIALFSITCLSAQEFIGKDWDIDNFLGEFPDVTDVYFLKKPRQKNPCVADNTILFRPDGTFFPPCIIWSIPNGGGKLSEGSYWQLLHS